MPKGRPSPTLWGFPFRSTASHHVFILLVYRIDIRNRYVE